MKAKVQETDPFLVSVTTALRTAAVSPAGSEGKRGSRHGDTVS